MYNMKCIIIKSHNPAEDMLDEYVYTYYLMHDNFNMDNFEKYCYTTDDEEYDPSKVFQFYKGEHCVLNCVNVDTTNATWKKELKKLYNQLII